MFLYWFQGDIVTLIQCVDTNWYEGRLDGRQGLFPVSFVEHLVDADLSPVTSPIPLSNEINNIMFVSISSWIGLRIQRSTVKYD